MHLVILVAASGLALAVRGSSPFFLSSEYNAFRLIRGTASLVTAELLLRTGFLSPAGLLQ